MKWFTGIGSGGRKLVSREGTAEDSKGRAEIDWEGPREDWRGRED